MQIVYITVEDKIKLMFRPVKRSSKKTVTPIIARARKLQQNDPVEKNVEKNDTNTTILSARQQCKLLFNKLNQVQRIVTC